MSQDKKKLKLSSDASGEAIDAEIASLAQADVETPAPQAQGRFVARPGAKRRGAGRVAALAITAALTCTAMTLFNLGLLTPPKKPAQVSPHVVEQDLSALMSVEVALLEDHRMEHGSYPVEAWEAGLDEESGHYIRISPDRFELTLVDDGVAITVNSAELGSEAGNPSAANSEEALE